MVIDESDDDTSGFNIGDFDVDPDRIDDAFASVCSIDVSWLKTVLPEFPSKVWRIDVKDAKRTLEMTT